MQFVPSASGGSSGRNSSRIGASSSRSGTQSNETPLTQRSTASAAEQAHTQRRRRHRRRRPQPLPSIELEAVVSCTSDGLVVILRRARPAIPPAHPPLALSPWEFENGLFAAPWAQQPVRPQVPPEMIYNFRAPLLPQYMPLRESVKAAGGPPEDYLMRSIRDVAVFAWALVGINGNLAAYSHGHAHGEAAPPEGLPVWDPSAQASPGYQSPHNQAAARWAAFDQSIDKGKAPATAQGANQNNYHARFSRDLPPPVFGMPSYLQSGPAYAYQSSGRGYVPCPPQQSRHYDDHVANSGFPPEPWKDEQQAQSGAAFSVPATKPPSGSGLPQAYDGGWDMGR